MLRSRNCCLDLESHKYFWDPDGARIPMRVSVTGVINHGKDPDRFKGFEGAAHRGTHVHRCMEALAKDEELPPCISPEGIDCSDWFDQLHHGEISKGLTMSDFWKEAEILATEYTMVSPEALTRRSAGSAGQVPGGDLAGGSQDQISQLQQQHQRRPRQLCSPGWGIPLADGLRRWSQRRTPALCREMPNADRHAQSSEVDHRHGPMQLRRAWEEAWGVYSLPWLLFDPRPSRTQDTPPNTNPTP